MRGVLCFRLGLGGSGPPATPAATCGNLRHPPRRGAGGPWGGPKVLYCRRFWAPGAPKCCTVGAFGPPGPQSVRGVLCFRLGLGGRAALETPETPETPPPRGPAFVGAEGAYGWVRGLLRGLLGGGGGAPGGPGDQNPGGGILLHRCCEGPRGASEGAPVHQCGPRRAVRGGPGALGELGGGGWGPWRARGPKSRRRDFAPAVS